MSRRRRRRAHVQMDVLGEASSIVERAVLGEACAVTLGPVVFFSTQAGDAWLLDPADALARCLARGGDALPVGIVETAETFTIEWDVHFSLDGDAFRVVEDTGKVTEIVGYPVDELRGAIRRL